MDAEWQSFDGGYESPSGSGAGDSYDDTGWSYHLASVAANAAAMQTQIDHLSQFDDEEQSMAEYSALVARVHSLSVQQSMLKGRERYSAKQDPVGIRHSPIGVLRLTSGIGTTSLFWKDHSVDQNYATDSVENARHSNEISTEKHFVKEPTTKASSTSSERFESIG